MIGIYVHIPFCKSKCPYCDFHSVGYTSEKMREYVAALKSEMEHYKGITADTLYFGGGTPTLLPSDVLGDLVETAKDCFSLKNAEITAEANPTELDYSCLEGLQKAGINRLSVGIQSLSNEELSSLGRRHNANRALSALFRAKEVGFSNLSADLMIGIPHQTSDSLKNTLSLLSQVELAHISAYLLTIEPTTPFGKNPPKCPEEEKAAELYLMAAKQLENMGFTQYEISNFAKPGFESKHNLKYWRQEEYIGLGSSAHSFLKKDRFYHPADIEGYIKNPLQTVFSERGGDKKEWLMLRLRLAEGVTFEQAKTRGFSIESLCEKTKKLVRDGLAFPCENRICLTPKGMLLSNAVILYLLNN